MPGRAAQRGPLSRGPAAATAAAAAACSACASPHQPSHPLGLHIASDRALVRCPAGYPPQHAGRGTWARCRCRLAPTTALRCSGAAASRLRRLLGGPAPAAPRTVCDALAPGPCAAVQADGTILMSIGSKTRQLDGILWRWVGGPAGSGRRCRGEAPAPARRARVVSRGASPLPPASTVLHPTCAHHIVTARRPRARHPSPAPTRDARRSDDEAAQPLRMQPCRGGPSLTSRPASPNPPRPPQERRRRDPALPHPALPRRPLRGLSLLLHPVPQHPRQGLVKLAPGRRPRLSLARQGLVKVASELKPAKDWRSS